MLYVQDRAHRFDGFSGSRLSDKDIAPGIFGLTAWLHGQSPVTAQKPDGWKTLARSGAARLLVSPAPPGWQSIKFHERGDHEYFIYHPGGKNFITQERKLAR